jgi:asparagine synthase (glutamine-hydrolysing)
MGRRGTDEQHVLPNDRGFVAVRPGISVSGLHSVEGTIVAMCGVPRIAGAEAPRTAGPNEVVRAFLNDYRKRGAEALASLCGSFCMALIDERTETLLLAVDRIGIEQLFFAPVAGGIAFASSVDMLSGHPDIVPRISAQALFDYMYFHVIPSPVAIVDGMIRLQPGECLLWKRGHLERIRYWRPQFDENDSRPFGTLKEEFVGVLRSAIKDAIADGKAGTFLSGGTDSSTITGLMGQCAGGPADTYSIGFEAEGYDEMQYARIAARHFGARHHEYYVTPEDVVAAVPKLAAIFDQPFGNSSAVPVYYCARLAAADGVTQMLGGDGGDELFGGNVRYATQYVFSLYENIPRPVRRWVVEPVARRLSMNLQATRKVRRYVEQASVPMPARTETYNFLRVFGYETVFAPDVLQRIDVEQPLALQAESYFNPSARSLINRQLALDMKFTLADNDLPKVTRACELAGLRVAFPMLDARVVDFSLRLQPHLKLRGAKLRYFFKEALRGFLPDAVINKQKHGFGLPFGPWVVQHSRLRALAFDSLSDLKRRHIFNAELIDRLPAQLDEHPPYYGTMVWILMMLEQWFKIHAPAADGRNL